MTPSSPLWLDAAVSEMPTTRRKPLPAWVEPATLPSLTVQGHDLTPEEVQACLLALRDSTLEKPVALVTQMREHCDARWREPFALALFERWLENESPSPERWAFEVLAHWGGDLIVRRLVACIRDWPSKRLHQRAMRALTFLPFIGTDAALYELALLGRDRKLGRIAMTALGLLHTAASDRGLSYDQLGDRLVPTFGLDGERIFDFGPRQFHLALTQDLKACVRDAAGKVRADLPKPAASDDPTRAASALAEWKELKHLLRDVLRLEVERLQESLVDPRIWKVEAFLGDVVAHPLLRRLASRLLWGGINRKKQLKLLFRLNEDGQPVDGEGNPATLDDLEGVRLVHPILLTPEQRTHWTDLFADHEIVPPFPQLTRPVRTLDEEDQEESVLVAQEEIHVRPITLLGLCERMGWERGLEEGALEMGKYGGCNRHVRTFARARLIAVLTYDPGISAYGYHMDDDPQEVQTLHFVRAGKHLDDDRALPLAKIDPVILSEVLDFFAILASKHIG
ncbi:MAG: DUF4132 domain-containing protein [Gemmataceae bacterium]